MKKMLTIATVVLFVSGVAVSGFAQTTHAKKAAAAPEVISGMVVSVDTVNKQIVVTDGKTGQNRVFVVSEKAAAVVKAGEKVEVKLKPGSNTTSSVKVLKQKSKKK